MALKIPTFAKRLARALGVNRNLFSGSRAENAKYWSDVNVTSHAQFQSAAASLDYFHWRNSQYHHYIELMPVEGQDGKVVLDYGCGPGNDLVGFSVYSRPSRLIGLDVSPRSIAEAKVRVALHSDQVEIALIREQDERLSVEDGSVDYVHSSGVVHHAADPVKVLREFRRVLKPSGKCRIMVYNYDSIWVHLYVAYIKMIRARAYPGMDLRAAFGKTTDGEDCPISRVYQSHEFIALAKQAGFSGRFLGAGISLFECSLLPERFEALGRNDFPREHRDFLLALEFDKKGYPLYNNHYAGIDGCYELTPIT